MIKSLSILLILTLISFNVWSSCDRPIELDRPGFSMEHVPVLDQDGLKMCRVYSAVQMADAWRFSHGDRSRRRTSPLATGLRQSKYDWTDWDSSNLDNYGGYHCDIVNYMRSSGGCAMKASIESLGGKSPKDTLSYLASFYDRNHSGRVNKRARSNDLHCELPRLGMPANFVPSVEAITRLLDGNRDDFIRGVLTKRCEGANRIRIPSAPLCVESIANLMTVNQVVNYMNAILERPNPQPLNIAYCSNILTEGRKFNPPKFPGFTKTNCRLHASLVIGRRKNARTGKCEFKVRNTWGSSCRPYSSDWTCQGGNIWIEGEQLAKSVGRFSTWIR